MGHQKASVPASPTVQAVDHCLDLVEALSANDVPRGVTELGAELHLAKSTVHRLLQTLMGRGYVAQDSASGRYRLGLRFLELGAAVMDSLSIRTAAEPYLQELMEATRETVHLGVLEGHEVVYVDKIECPRTIRMYSRVGRRSPLHCTALGKVLLAYQPEEVFRALPRSAYHRFTPRTITTPARLHEELKRVREDGYAVDNQEFEDGLRCVAAPVRDHRDRVVASLGIAGPTARLKPIALPALIKRLKESADAISAALGYREGRPDRHRTPGPERKEPGDGTR
ncbi:MAG TPA: IclR family transcriptional regulator [Candidatus Sulfotelmatobacter sp.]|nr:IclR family transcriptional regulator [Candidatus Sulfotelmatobacter sp.]